MTGSHFGEWNRDFPKWKFCISQWTACVALLTRPKLTWFCLLGVQIDSHFTEYLSVWNVFLIAFQNCEILLLYSSSPSLYQIASPQWKIFPGVLGDISKIFLEISCFTYVWDQIAKMEYKGTYVCLSVPPLLCPTETTHLPTRGFMVHTFWKFDQKFLQLLKSDKKDGYFTWNVCTFVIIYA